MVAYFVSTLNAIQARSSPKKSNVYTPVEGLPEVPKTRLARIIDDEALDALLTATCWL